MCKECYTSKNRITPLLHPLDCLKQHRQYICGSCGRCICIEKDPHRGLQRWNFPFKNFEIAMLYLRTADYTMKTSCAIYAIKNEKGRFSYKILANDNDLATYLNKNKGKICEEMKPVFMNEVYQEYPTTQVRQLSMEEIEKYMSERNA